MCCHNRTHQALRGSIHRTETEVRREDLPHHLRLEPHVRLCAANLDVPPRFHHLERFEGIVVGLQRLLAEPGADLAYRLILLCVRVVAREQERAVDVRALALAEVRADDDKVERVADAGEVVFLELRNRRALAMNGMGSRAAD